MTYKTLYILFFVIFTSSCDSGKLTKKNLQDIKINQIRQMINKTGFINFPLKFDAGNENSLKSRYSVDFSGNDSLIFNSDSREVIGFLPDTSKYYAMLYYSIGDILYPTIMTISKQGIEIDRQIICTAECAGQTAVDVISCYDSVKISKDLKIVSVSKMIGKVDSNDSIPKTLDVCNMIKINGFIDGNGKIKLNRSELIDCNQ